MFTGLIEEVGTVKQINMGAKSGTIQIKAAKILDDAKLGDSIAVNGVCLTATGINADTFTADVMAETFRRSSLGSLKSGSYVNLERAMAADGRFGGHIVSGHIDGTGKITNIVREENAIWYTISAKAQLLNYIVEKGSIAIDGISLTVAYVDSTCFKVSIIPHTESETILKYKRQGDIVNLECDIIGKYVEKFLMTGISQVSDNTGTEEKGQNQTGQKQTGQKQTGQNQTGQKKNSGITLEFLAENGFS